MRVLSVLAVAGGMLCLVAIGARAAPTEWSVAAGGNGHWYEVVGGRANWEGASAAATAAGGYLATITSDAENGFVFGLTDSPAFWTVGGFNDGLGPWLGGFQPAGSTEPAGGWSWVSGEVFGYSNWAPFQPNDFTFDGYPTENSIHYYSSDAASVPRSPQWNDLWGEVQLSSYVVEWNANPIPEPGTWLQLGVGLAVLGFIVLGRFRHTRPG